MKKILRSLILFSLITSCITGCTNQPISNNKQLPTKELVGYWQPAGSDLGYIITQRRDGTAGAEQVMYNSISKKFNYTDHGTVHCYFKTLKKDGRVYHIMSLGDSDGYRTFLYSFDKKKRLQLREVNYDFMAGKRNTGKGELQKFIAPGYFSDFLQANLGNENLFDEATTYNKRKNLKDFAKPGKG